MAHINDNKLTTASSGAPPLSNDMKENHKADAAIPLYERMILAAFAGMGAATVCHPLDVLRVQMQTEGVQYKNTLDAAVQIYKRSGLRGGLYAGISAAYLRQWLYGSCRIGIYANLLEKAQLANVAAGKDKNDIAFHQKLGMGCISGGIGSFVGTPSELALVRMSADSKLPPNERRNYKNVIDCVRRIATEEGPTKLWRGATPTVARATLLSACQMGVTSEIKSKLIQSGVFGQNGEYGYGLPIMFCATLCSSFCANIVANPFDVVKSRLQNMQISSTPQYTGMADCFVKSVKADGITVLFAGFTPAFIKLAPYTVISLTLADKLTRAITGKDAL
jgi:solute carrier family 25 oxoglutarate transporter 11